MSESTKAYRDTAPISQESRVLLDKYVTAITDLAHTSPHTLRKTLESFDAAEKALCDRIDALERASA